MNKKVFLVGGGTGGHLFPALALGQELAKRNYSISLITDSRCEKYLPKNLELDTHILSLGSLKSSFGSKIFMSIKMFFALMQSIFLFTKHKPSLVVGFGGYTAFPSLLAAKFCNIPIMIHEQNCFLGKVNKIFAACAKKIALNFPDTQSVSKGLDDKIVITGNPVRQEILNNVVEYKDRKKDAIFNILVIGGSQSAKVFSSIIPAAIAVIKDKCPKLKLSIVQQASRDDAENLGSIYSRFCKKFEVAEFFADMPKRYNDSDIVICRSGASTIAELIALGKPAIMIPFPMAADNHQFYNAKFLADRNAGWCFEQKNITPEILAGKIIEIANDNVMLKNISQNLSGLRRNSSCILADTVDEIMLL